MGSAGTERAQGGAVADARAVTHVRALVDDALAATDAGAAIAPMWKHISEMPTIDLRFATKQTRHFWFGTNNPALGPMLPRGAKGPPFTCLGHFDAATGQLDFFYAGPHSSPEEPVFVPGTLDAEEGDGWLMSIVGRRDENRTDLVILDARDLSAGPVATIRLPCRVHVGFHGIWVPGTALSPPRVSPPRVSPSASA